MKLLAAAINLPERIMTAVVGMSEVVPFFPQTQIAKELIAAAIAQFVSTPEQLDWLTDTVIRSQREWSGIPELRGLFCSRFQPKDGITVEATTPGYTREDELAQAERSYFERESRETDAKLALWRKERAALPEAERTAIDQVTSRVEVSSARRLERGSPNPASRPGQSAPIVIHATRARTPEEHQAEVTRLELALRNRGRDTATQRLQQIVEG
jgi:hypothetical protein